MKGKTSIVLAVALLLMVSCSKQKKHYSDIENMEKKLYSENFTYDDKGKAEAMELVTKYLSYAEMYPDDTLAPEFTFRAADLTMNFGDASKAINLYNKIIYTYPGYRRNPECLFLIAFIYDNHLQNYGKARQVYEEFLSRYPDHDFADDASMSIRNLGKSPEELVNEFENKGQNEETAGK